MLYGSTSVNITKKNMYKNKVAKCRVKTKLIVWLIRTVLAVLFLISRVMVID